MTVVRRVLWRMLSEVTDQIFAISERCLQREARAAAIVRLLPILIILFVGLVPVTWFEDGLIISYFDDDFPLPPFYNLETFRSAWYGQAAPGLALARPPARLLYVNFFVFFNRLGIPLHTLQALYFACCTLLAGFSMYYLFLAFFKIRFHRAGALIAALLYMNNPILYHVIWRYMTVIFYPAYAVTPLILVLFSRGVRSGRILKYAALITMLLLVGSLWGTDLPYATPTLAILVGYVVFSIATSASWKRCLTVTVKLSLVTGTLSLLLHSWWLALLLSSWKRVFTISDSYRSAISSSSLDTMLTYSKMTSFVNLFQMQGQLASYTKDIGNTPWSSYDPTYLTPPFVILGFIVPILAVLGMLNRRGGKWRVYFGALWILALVTMGGAHPPLGKIYIWFFENFPYAAAYRAFYNKFGLLLPFACSVLTGLGAMGILQQSLKLVEKKRMQSYHPLINVLLVLSLVAALSIWTYPFWTGEIIARSTQVRGGAKVQIPAYYSETDAWLQRQGHDFRVMILPLPRLYMGAYRWDHGYYGHDPSVWLFSAPTIGRITTPESYVLPLRVAELINLGEPTNSACLLGLLNTRYVLLHGDTSWEYVNNRGWWVAQPGLDESWLRESLSIQPGLHHAATIGQLHLYENAKVLPHTYVARRLVYLNGGLEEMISQYTTCGADSRPAIFLSELEPTIAPNGVEMRQAGTDAADWPAITTTRLSPARYTVHVNNARAPFLLVFGESYDRDWSAKISDRAITSHFQVNGYANAWHIEQVGSFDIEICFEKQRILELGFALSGLGVLLTIAAMVIGCTRFQRDQYPA